MKILFICSNLIGDTILSSGVIRYLIDQNRDAQLSFVIGPTAAPLLKNYENVENLIIFKKRKFNLHWINILQKTYRTNWDIVVDFRSSAISYLLRTKRKYIFKKNTGYHHIDQLNKSFGFNCSNLFIPTSLEEDEIANINIKKNFKHIVIFPGGNWKPKLWSIEKYNLVMQSLLKKYKNIRFVLVGTLIERKKFYDKLIKGINEKSIIDLFGFNLTLTSAYMQKSNLFIGNDSGLMHLAVSSNLNVISLFGPTDDSVYGPYGNKHIIIRTKENLDYFKSINIDQNISYMNSINHEEVVKNCEFFLNDKIN